MYQNYLKRLFDVLLASLILLFACPLFLMIYLSYKISHHSPVFFRQLRIGKNFEPFEILKYRTLSVDEFLPVHQRKFWLGNLLRSTSLDELPQLINVLRGDMSLVGPRPLPIKYVELFNDQQRNRHLIRPGITGWAQVNGRHQLTWPEKFRFDLEYLERCSFLFDMHILIKTILLLLSFRKDNSLEEREFTGNE